MLRPDSGRGTGSLCILRKERAGKMPALPSVVDATPIERSGTTQTRTLETAGCGTQKTKSRSLTPQKARGFGMTTAAEWRPVPRLDEAKEQAAYSRPYRKRPGTPPKVLPRPTPRVEKKPEGREALARTLRSSAGMPRVRPRRLVSTPNNPERPCSAAIWR